MSKERRARLDRIERAKHGDPSNRVVVVYGCSKEEHDAEIEKKISSGEHPDSLFVSIMHFSEPSEGALLQ